MPAKVVSIDDEKKIIDVATGEQYELDFGERFLEVCQKQVDSNVNALLKLFANMGISEEMCNKVMNMLALECDSITYHEQKK